MKKGSEYGKVEPCILGTNSVILKYMIINVVTDIGVKTKPNIGTIEVGPCHKALTKAPTFDPTW